MKTEISLFKISPGGLLCDVSEKIKIWRSFNSIQDVLVLTTKDLFYSTYRNRSRFSTTRLKISGTRLNLK